MNRGLLETLMGAVVLGVAALFFFYAYSASGVGKGGGYEVTARFGTVGPLKVGNDVRMSGIKVGVVSSQSLDPDTYLAEITLSIENGIQLPLDSSAAIANEGLLGGAYVDLVPGAEDEMLKPGERIELTQDAVDFVQLLSRFMFSAGSDAGSN
jgi:phospholipid/cholesterol/gamma-HCH transport system substrate-binding protein